MDMEGIGVDLQLLQTNLSEKKLILLLVMKVLSVMFKREKRNSFAAMLLEEKSLQRTLFREQVRSINEE